jgi:large subunit ribosomal protein L25
MAEYTLKTEVRNVMKKSQTKGLRREGKIPAIYYFHKQRPIPLAVDLKEFHNAMQSGSHIFKIDLGDKSRSCVIKDIQYDPVTDNIIHIDFMGVTLKETIHIQVPIHLSGTAVGVKEFGGVLEQHLWELDVKCLASNIPEDVTVDVTNLNIGESISVGDIELEGAEVLTSSSTSIVSVVTPTGAKVTEEVPAEEEIEEEVETGTEEKEESKE